MAEDKNSNERNEVEIDLDKYMKLIEQLDEQEDKIKDMQAEAAAAKKRLAPPKRKFIDLFLDDNDINEKSIIGFLSFFLIPFDRLSDCFIFSFSLTEPLVALSCCRFSSKILLVYMPPLRRTSFELETSFSFE